MNPQARPSAAAAPTAQPTTFDVIVIGAGIAGASLAWHLAPGLRVAVLEREAQPGYHATGRSAAMFMESYGPAQVRALTRASRAFYSRPPEGFAEGALLQPRGVIYLAAPGQEALLDATRHALADGGHRIEPLTREQVLARVPALRPGVVAAGLAEPDAQDIDVHALHQGFLRGARRAGVFVRCDAELTAAAPSDDGWRIELAGGEVLHARTVVNAAGAWADVVAQAAGVRPLGLQPCRRSAFTVDVPAGVELRHWPAVVGIDESWYFKPDAGRLLGSPANADPVPPQDVQAEELDIAIGMDHLSRVLAFGLGQPASRWAGLRTFSPDGEMVIGWDAGRPGFFWLAGQGGYGIQSAAAAGELAAALIRGEAVPAALAREGVRAEALSPRRFPVTA